MLAPSHSDVSESRDADEDERRSSEAVLKITLDFLRRMEQDELSHLLQTSTFLKMLRSPGALMVGLELQVLQASHAASVFSQRLSLPCATAGSSLC